MAILCAADNNFITELAYERFVLVGDTNRVMVFDQQCRVTS